VSEFFDFLNVELLELNIKLTEFEFSQEFENMKMPGRYWAFDVYQVGTGLLMGARQVLSF